MRKPVANTLVPRPSSLVPASGLLVSFRSSLLSWYSAHRRDLPWRRTRDPYAIWLSEAMLQQTTVRTVEPRWQRFLQKYPTLAELARAPLDDVLAEWSGLGYYARARNLHAAAQIVARDFDGRVPDSFEALLALPGMGRYTAAAVASIAFNAAVPVVDANVERVLIRLDAIAENPKSPAIKRRLWDRAAELLDPKHPGDWNQAMMELGATVCLPRTPQCPACPVAEYCAARAGGEPERFPIKTERAPMRDVREVAVILERRGKFLVLQRLPNVSFGGMWETPRGEVQTDSNESTAAAAERIVLEQTGLTCEAEKPLLNLRHVVMRRRIELQVWRAKPAPGRVQRVSHAAAEWIAPDEWLRRPASTTQRAIAEWLATGRLPERLDTASVPAGPDMFDELAT